MKEIKLKFDLEQLATLYKFGIIGKDCELKDHSYFINGEWESYFFEKYIIKCINEELEKKKKIYDIYPEIVNEKQTDNISIGVSASQRPEIQQIKEIIAVLESIIKAKEIPINEIIRAAREKGISEDKVSYAIEKLKRSGNIFEPRKDFFQIV